jgi:signal peptide peptidase SppA
MQRIGARPALIRMQDVEDDDEEAAPYLMEDGIAIINICGPLYSETYAAIQKQLIAAEDPEVKGAVLNFNTPGGVTDGAFETADAVAHLAAMKPVYGVAATKAYSAGYLLASQCTKVYCSPVSGGVGSIGVKCYHADYSGALQQAGIKITSVSAGSGKTDGDPYEPLTDDGRSKIQAEVDRLYGQFVGAVARGRGITPQDLVSMGAQVFNGSGNALASGLADASGDLSTAWVDLCTATQKAPENVVNPGFNMAESAVISSESEQVNMETKAADTTTPVAVDIEAVTAAAKDAGYAMAADVVELCAIAGKPALAASFIAAKKPVADVRKELLAARVAADQGTELNTSVMPGVDASTATNGTTEGKAKPWADIMAAVTGRKK